MPQNVFDSYAINTVLPCDSGKEVIIVHDNHGGGGGGAEYGAGTAAGWVSGHTATGWSTGGGADSYSAGSHVGGGDNTYAGAQDSYSSGIKKKKNFLNI